VTLLAAVIRLEAAGSGAFVESTGRAVHGLWFRHWETVAPPLARALHRGNGPAPFSLSPLLGLPRPRDGAREVGEGHAAWFRVCALRADVARGLREAWLPGLPGEVRLCGVRWRVRGWTSDASAHPLAGEEDAQRLADRCLFDRRPLTTLRLRFLTPTAFHGAGGHLPFPLPDALVRSWLRRWEAFGPVRLPDDLDARARAGLLVSAYRLQTVPVREKGRLTIGCVGELQLRMVGLSAGERAALHLLAAYAGYAGSGHRTTQGMGVTRLIQT